QRRRLAVAEIRKAGLITRTVLPHVGPAMDVVGKRDRCWRGTAAVMPPAVNRRTIANTGKPALIADSHLADHVADRTRCHDRSVKGHGSATKSQLEKTNE